MPNPPTNFSDERRVERLSLHQVSLPVGSLEHKCYLYTLFSQRRIAAFTHASIWLNILMLLLNCFLPIGVLVPLIVFLITHKRSSFLASSALQALVMQVVGTISILLVTLLILTTAVLSAWFLSMFSADASGFAIWGAVFLLLAVVPAVMAIYVLVVGTWAAVRALQGRSFSYPFVNRLIPLLDYRTP